ncbi:Manganese transport system membrane protein mntB [Actinomyces bovis]|uniref:Manganese transport system membrane protein mntB n=1 Tax=Actinomyces bovis TaxID=1658 RepID=A0ABY1VMY6_9ACTO|nr:metal ABC transporter permease [Actinomyces bovis]SPT53456.1 Manganese transport system membrane protein mntB [Actinomyces bovis]VEG52941.1 Manganese transport system membrane protein mntB [Actinomyces israelii]
MQALIELVAEAVEALRLVAVHIPGLSPLAQAPYLFRPLIMVLLLGVVCAVVGTLVNLRTAEFTAEALVHAVFPGIVAGAVYGGIDSIVPAASAVAVVAAGVLTWVAHRAGRRNASEAGTAVVLTGFFSVGIVLSLAKGDLSGQLEALMFGRLLEVTDLRLTQALVICLLALLAVGLTWKEQVAYAFDATGARAGGTRLLALDLVLNLAVAAVVVSAATAVGTLLVIGFLVVPGAAGRVLGRRVRSMVLVALAVGAGGGYLGLLLMTLPLQRPVSPQASVALTMTVILLLAALWAQLSPVIGRKLRQGHGAQSAVDGVEGRMAASGVAEPRL